MTPRSFKTITESRSLCRKEAKDAVKRWSERQNSVSSAGTQLAISLQIGGLAMFGSQLAGDRQLASCRTSLMRLAIRVKSQVSLDSFRTNACRQRSRNLPHSPSGAPPRTARCAATFGIPTAAVALEELRLRFVFRLHTVDEKKHALVRSMEVPGKDKAAAAFPAFPRPAAAHAISRHGGPNALEPLYRGIGRTPSIYP